MNNLFGIDKVDYVDFEKEIIRSVFFDVDSNGLFYEFKTKNLRDMIYSRIGESEGSVEESSTGIYLKRSFECVDTLIFCCTVTNTTTLNIVEVSVDINAYLELWKKRSIPKIVIDYLSYDYGSFEVEYVDKDCCFKWVTPYEIVTLTMRHPANMEAFYYPYKIAVRENLDDE